MQWDGGRPTRQTPQGWDGSGVCRPHAITADFAACEVEVEPIGGRNLKVGNPKGSRDRDCPNREVWVGRGSGDGVRVDCQMRGWKLPGGGESRVKRGYGRRVGGGVDRENPDSDRKNGIQVPKFWFTPGSDCRKGRKILVASGRILSSRSHLVRCRNGRIGSRVAIFRADNRGGPGSRPQFFGCRIGPIGSRLEDFGCRSGRNGSRVRRYIPDRTVGTRPPWQSVPGDNRHSATRLPTRARSVVP